MNILSRCLRRPPVLPAAHAAAAPAEVGRDDEAAGGCGWFDSSHELQTGLWVREHGSPDEVAAVLPLASWLELHLAGWQAVGRPLEHEPGRRAVDAGMMAAHERPVPGAPDDVTLDHRAGCRRAAAGRLRRRRHRPHQGASCGWSTPATAMPRSTCASTTRYARARGLRRRRRLCRGRHRQGRQRHHAQRLGHRAAVVHAPRWRAASTTRCSPTAPKARCGRCRSTTTWPPPRAGAPCCAWSTPRPMRARWTSTSLAPTSRWLRRCRCRPALHSAPRAACSPSTARPGGCASPRPAARPTCGWIFPR